MTNNVKKTQSGFTLIELMIAVSIIAILMAVGIPSYQSQVQRGQRSDAQRVMLELASQQEQFMMNRQTYSTDLGSSGLNYTLPSSVTEYYDFAVALTAGPPEGFIITATAKGSQASDGNLTLSSDGTKAPSEKW